MKSSVMTKVTHERLCEKLYTELSNHPHKDEIITLMDEQVADDTIL